MHVFAPVRLGLGQSSCSGPQLQLHADPPPGVQEPAVAHPRLLHGENNTHSDAVNVKEGRGPREW